jgi:hypothetical protein
MKAENHKVLRQVLGWLLFHAYVANYVCRGARTTNAIF